MEWFGMWVEETLMVTIHNYLDDQKSSSGAVHILFI